MNEKNILELVESLYTPEIISILNNEEDYKEVVRNLDGKHLVILFTDNIRKPSLLYK